MSTDLPIKRNNSGMQVIKTLQVLLEGNYTMNELVEKLNENESEPIFNNSVVSKYINTCRYCGIEIPKIHNRYFVANLPFGMNLSHKDIELIELLQRTAKNKLTTKPNKIFDKFIERISKYSNKYIVRIEKGSANLTYEFFDKAIQEKRKIVLMFRTKSVLECIPISIEEKNDKVYFNVFYNGKQKSIAVDRVSGIEVLDRRFSPQEHGGQNVVYKLTGDLAKRYSLREHESIVVQNLPESITVSNHGENKEELLTRLLRYDKYCEILNPRNYREEIKAIIDNMLVNYGE